MKLLYPLAKRFIAGDDVKSMIHNIVYYDLVTINYVGETATTDLQRLKNLTEYLHLIDYLKGTWAVRQYEISIW